MLKLRIVSPEKVVFDGEVEGVKVPGVMGSFEILTNHAAIITSLAKGQVEYRSQQGVRQLDVQGGFAEVKQNVVSLCVEV